MKKSHSANDSEELFREDDGGGDAAPPRAASFPHPQLGGRPSRAGTEPWTDRQRPTEGRPQPGALSAQRARHSWQSALIPGVQSLPDITVCLFGRAGGGMPAGCGELRGPHAHAVASGRSGTPGGGGIPQGLSLFRVVPSGLTCPPRARGPVRLAACRACRPRCRRGPGSQPLSVQCLRAGLHLPAAVSAHVGPAVSQPCGGAAAPCSSEEQREAI